MLPQSRVRLLHQSPTVAVSSRQASIIQALPGGAGGFFESLSMKIVAYQRASTRDQKNSLDAQRAAVKAWAKAKGLAVSSWHEDIGVSGATNVEDRPGLMAALREIGDGDTLVAATRDRLARSIIVAAVLDSLVREAGGTIATADGVSDEQTPEGHLVRGIFDIIAEFERARIRARTRAAMQVLRGRGQVTTGNLPYGFRREGKRLLPDYFQQSVILDMVAHREAGWTLSKIVKWLEENGTQAPRHGKKPRKGESGVPRWSPATVARILKRGALKTQ